jgi:hypothetical protein
MGLGIPGEASKQASSLFLVECLYHISVYTIYTLGLEVKIRNIGELPDALFENEPHNNISVCPLTFIPGVFPPGVLIDRH